MSMNLILEGLPADTEIAQEQLVAVGAGESSAELFDESNFEDGDDDFDDEMDLDVGENSLSLEKSWHALHFLLTGEAWSGEGWRAFMLCGGVEQGEDYGYGTARYFAPTEVSEIARGLESIEGDELWSKFDAGAMTAADIYPGIWDEEEDELEAEFLDYFEELKEFVSNISGSGEAMRILMV